MTFSALLNALLAPIQWLFSKFLPDRKEAIKEHIAKEHAQNRDDIDKFLKGD